MITRPHLIGRALALAALALGTNAAEAQDLKGFSVLYPSGARQGATVPLTVTGDEITAAAVSLWFSHPGIRAAKTGENTFTAAVAPDVPPGLYDVRAVGPKGVSDPRTFAVGDLPEAPEIEPNNEPKTATKLPALPVTINGTVNPDEDVDLFRFSASAGQHLIGDLYAARIDATPRAVNTVFEPAVQVLSAAGKILRASRRELGPDPVLHWTCPKTGEYLLRVQDFTYRGGDQCVYRVRLGILPQLDYVFPAGGRRGTEIPVRFGGRNLGGTPAPGSSSQEIVGKVSLASEESPPDSAYAAEGFARCPEVFLEHRFVGVDTPGGRSNPVLFMVGDLPERPGAGTQQRGGQSGNDCLAVHGERSDWPAR